MADAVIRLRFVRHRGFACGAIVWRSGMVGMPFIPTHVECVTPEWTCVGQFGYGGMQERPMGYDLKEIYIDRNYGPCAIIVELPATQTQACEFYTSARAAIGEPYDWSAPWGFLFPGHHHKKYHSVCSSKMFLLLRKVGYFRWPVTVPAHLIDPQQLMLVLSTHVEIPH